MNKKIVIVTGAAGFIGSALANHLVSLGYHVYGIDNLATGKRERLDSRVEFCQVDITDRAMLEECFLEIDLVAQDLSKDRGIYGLFHLAALPRVQYSIDHPVESHKVNVNGTMNVFLAAKDFSVRRVIYSASSSAYGEQPIPFREDMRAEPKSPYAAQKHFGELLARAYYESYGLDSICLRYFNVYGPHADPKGSYPQALINFVYQRSQNLPLTVTGTGENTRDSVYISDVVGANVMALERKLPCKGISVNIGSGRNVSVIDMAKMVGGENHPIEHITPRIEPKDTLADITLAKKFLGWEPTVTLEKGIARMKEKYGIS